MLSLEGDQTRRKFGKQSSRLLFQNFVAQGDKDGDKKLNKTEFWDLLQQIAQAKDKVTFCYSARALHDRR